MRGEDAHLAGDGADLVEAATVRPGVLFQDAAADLVAHDALEALGERLVAEFFRQLLRYLVAQGVFLGLQRDLVRVFLERIGQAGAHNAADAAIQLRCGILVGFDLELGLPDLGHKFFDEADDFGVGLLGAADGLEDDLLGDLVGAGLHHDDGIAGAADDHTQGAVVALLVGGVDDVLAVAVGDAAGADRAFEGYLRDGQCRGCAHHRQDFRRVLLVGGEDCQGDLHVVVQALGEQGADGTVGEPGSEDALLPGAAFATEEAAGDAPGGVEPFFVVHGQGQKVYVLGARAVRHDGGCQHDGLAVADSNGAVGLEGEASGFQDQGFPADVAVDHCGGCKFSCHNKTHDLTQR